ncbi:MAG: histidine phosphatase family protein [Baekduia sp.]
MAIDLWLLRHGEAEPHGSRPDAERELTKRGRAQSRQAGAALAALGVSFDVIYASPKVRARDTAMLAAEPLGIEPVLDAGLAAGPDAGDALALAHAGRVLLVGHDPYLSQLVHDLTGARVRLPKGSLCGIRIAPPGELAVLLRPRDLAAMAEGG